jgi:Flp pilus assembly protein TadD
LIADLDYTLRAIPNHRRALAAVAKYQLSGGKFDVVEINGADCYFLRALAFTPTDAAVRLIYGNYLYKSKELQKAEEMYTSALALDPGSAEIAYNAGLYYVTKGDVAKAEGMAKIAYDQGYPLPGLRNRINALKQSQASPKAAVKR